MSSSTAQYRKASLSPEQAAQVEAMLERKGKALLELKIEIFDLGANLKSLAWIGNSITSDPGKLVQCTLSSAQWAECMIALEQGLRPVYNVVWQVLGKLEDGCYGIAGGTIESVKNLPGLHWGELDKMVGLRFNS